MKTSLARIVPTSLRPMARRIYTRWTAGTAKTNSFSTVLDKQDVLNCVVSYNQYGGYCVPDSSRHRTAAKKILSAGVYEPETIRFIRSNCGSGDIVHAGTYFGDLLPALSQGCSPDSKVWAFEPNPENFRCAKITLELNGIDNVNLTNAGLGEKRGSLLLKVTDDSGRSLGGASRIVAEAAEDANELEKVEIVSIDDVVDLDREVSIIQLDVEGHEKEALIGAEETINRCKPILILEAWRDSTLFESRWFAENILGLGYRQTQVIHENTVFRC